VRDRAAAVAEGGGGRCRSGGGGDRLEWRRRRWSRERQGLRELWNEKQNDTGQTTIYRFENINNGS
jgi:hypothetical protein